MGPEWSHDMNASGAGAGSEPTSPTSASGRAPAFNSGYESPSEDNNPFVFSSPTVSKSGPEQGVSASPTPAVMRPTFLSRPSYMAAMPPSDSRVPTAVAFSPSNSCSMNGVIAKSEKPSPGSKIGLRDRIACYQWTYFTMTMATGGIANVLHLLPYKDTWITGLGVFFFLLNITLFLINCAMICTRFYICPGSFTNSFTDRVESLFVPAFVVSIAIIMINICEYGVPKCGLWLLRTMEIMFWVYVALSAIASAGMYLILWSTLIFPVHTMTPTWVFPAYPLLLTAPFAANLTSAAQASGHSLSVNTAAVAICAATAQGTGCLIAFMISAAFMYRLMTQKLPRDMQRPGVFISIGPFGFTAAGIAQLGSQAKDILPHGFLGTDHSIDIIKVVSILVSLWLWGLSMWFFLVSVGSLWKYTRSGHSMPFQMTWWSFVFPNTALVTATQVMGDVFQSRGLQIFGCGMTVALIIVWIGVFATMVHCLRTKKLLWPKDSV